MTESRARLLRKLLLSPEWWRKMLQRPVFLRIVRKALHLAFARARQKFGPTAIFNLLKSVISNLKKRIVGGGELPFHALMDHIIRDLMSKQLQNPARLERRKSSRLAAGT